MSLEITLPRLGKVTRAAKDLVISSLMYEYPLTLAKLTNSIKKQYAASVTFQGVRRAVNALVEDEVLIKDGRQYSINKKWITSLKDFSDRLYDSYYAKNSGIMNIESLGEEIKIYTFDNLIDADKFWNKTIAHWFKSGKEKVYCQQFGHMWQVLGQMQEETSVLDTIKN